MNFHEGKVRSWKVGECEGKEERVPGIIFNGFENPVTCMLFKRVS